MTLLLTRTTTSKEVGLRPYQTGRRARARARTPMGTAYLLSRISRSFADLPAFILMGAKPMTTDSLKILLAHLPTPR